MTDESRFVIAVGSNIEPAAHLPAALEELVAALEVERISPVFETPAVGAPGTPDFWNAAILARSPGSLEETKIRHLRLIESRLGRVRSSDRNAPRPIDLDLVLDLSSAGSGVEGRSLDPDLPRLAHLAVPVGDLVPLWRDPVSGRKLGDIADSMRGGLVEVDAVGWDLPGLGDLS